MRGEKMSQTKLALGVDIGGTNIKIGLVTDQGEIVDFESLPIKRNHDNSADLMYICKAMKKIIEKNQVFDQLVGVGVSSPGIIDPENGIVNYAINLGWENINLVEKMENF